MCVSGICCITHVLLDFLFLSEVCDKKAESTEGLTESTTVDGNPVDPSGPVKIDPHSGDPQLVITKFKEPLKVMKIKISGDAINGDDKLKVTVTDDDGDTHVVSGVSTIYLTMALEDYLSYYTGLSIIAKPNHKLIHRHLNKIPTYLHIYNFQCQYEHEVETPHCQKLFSPE